MTVAVAVAVMIAAAPQPAVAARTVDVGALTLRAPSERVVLGRTHTVTITIESTIDVIPPHVTASLGTIGGVERVAAGKWRVQYNPPGQGAPQVAVLLAALDTESADAVGYLALPLWGTGETVVHTKAQTAVTVHAGSATFGPIKADDSGVARVAIEIPPGVKSATTHALDDVGNMADRVIDLGVPPFLRVAAIALDEVAVSDGSGSARLFAVTVDDNGDPLTHANLSAKASLGTVAIGDEIAPGLRALVLSPPKTSEDRSVTVDVVLASTAAQTAHTRVALIPGAPAGALLSLSVDHLRDDDPDREVLASARLVDAAGAPLPPEAAGLHVDIGRIGKLLTQADGERTFTWVVPAKSKQTRATVSVHLPNGTVVASAGFDLLPGLPKYLVFDPPHYVVADGARGVDVIVRARDKSGAVVPPDGVVLSVNEGALGPQSTVRTAPPGSDPKRELGPADIAVRAHFTPVAAREPGSALVVARADGDVQSSTAVGLAPPPDPFLVGVGPDVGYNYEHLLAVGLDVTALQNFGGAFYAGASVGILQSLTRPAAALDHCSIPVLAEFAFRPQLDESTQLLLGLAAGPVVSDLTLPNGHTDLEVAIAGQVLLGLGLHLGPVPLDVFVRAGTSVYVGTGPAAIDAGVPLGAALVVAWRFAPPES